MNNAIDKLAEYRQYLFLSSELFCSMSNQGVIRDPIGPWEDKLGLTLVWVKEQD